MRLLPEQLPIHPRARGVAALVAIVGTLLVKNVGGAAIAWLVILVPLLFVTGVLGKHMRFVVTILAPISAALFAVWAWIVGAPPGAPMGSAPSVGAEFAGLISLRLALLGGISQLCFGTIPPDRLGPTLQSWKLQGEWLFIAVSSLTLVREMQLRAEQVLTARYARGLVPNRTFLARLRQLPYLLRPLMAWVLRSAIQRSEALHQRQLLARLENTCAQEQDSSRLSSAFYLALAASWLLYSIITRIR